MNNSTISVAKIFSILFFVLAILELISNLLPGESSFLERNLIFNFMHIITAIGLYTFAALSVETSILLIDLIGISYILISEIGFMGMSIKIADKWEDVLSLNLLTYVQFGLGIALCISGMMLKKRRHTEQLKPR